LSLREGYERAIAHEQELAREAKVHQRFLQLRAEAPFLAAQVEEGALTVAEAVEAHEAEVRAPVLAEHAEAIRKIGKRMADDIIEIGRRLTECKRICGHGNWLPWLDREFGWEETTARRFMSVYELEGKSGNLQDLSLPVSGIYLLAKPSTPEIVRD